jgi:DNA-binding XRE family transcriptional regulator
MKLEGDRKRLASEIVARRNELGLNQAELAARAGLSATTLRSLESGARTGRRESLRKLEPALGWQEGSAKAILAGGKPKLIRGWRLAAMSAPGELPGAKMTAAIARAVYAKGLREHGDADRAIAEFEKLATSLGLPGRGTLEVDEWHVVAVAAGMTLGQVLRDFAGYTDADLDLTARPPQPAVPVFRAVPEREDQRKRALVRDEGGLVHAVAPGR